MGFDFRKFAAIAELVGPAIMAAAGVPPVLIPIVVHGIQLAESSPQSGAEKKAVALDAVATGAAAVNAVKPGTIDASVTDVVSHGIDATVGAINLIQKKAA